MITQHIFALLYEHNCVVLPGFGGFIANRVPSRVNEAQQRVEPPRKVVAFNSNLIQNDGLLANHIAVVENMTYDNAVRHISDFVEVLKTEIQLKKYSAIKGVGDFYLNSENKIVFVPEADVNFSKETFGLFPISIRKILREDLLEDGKPLGKGYSRSKTLPAPKLKTKQNSKWAYSALLIALPLAVGFFTQQTGLLQQADFNISSVFSKKRIENTTTFKLVTPNETTSKAEVANNITEAKPINAPVVNAFKIPKDEVEPVSTPLQSIPNEAIEIAPAQAAVAPLVNIQYHIIGGSFAVPENAQNFLKQLQQKGYTSYIVGTNANGLAMVSYAGFASETDALLLLQKIQQSENSQAWLYNHDAR